jgi:signal transduction histidine kinase
MTQHPALRQLARRPALAMAGVVVLLLAVVVLQGWQFAVRGLQISMQDSTEASNRTLTRVFVNENWDAVKPLLPAPGSGSEAARSNPNIPAIDQIVRRFSSYTDVLKVKIYDRGGITVYSSDRAQIGEDKARNAGFQAAARGQVVSELIYRGTFGAFDGELYKRNLVATYVPVRVGEEIQAVLEIYSDRTASIDFTNRQLRSLALWMAPWVLAAVLLVAAVAWWLHREQLASARERAAGEDPIRPNEVRTAAAEAAMLGRAELLPTAFDGLGALVARVGAARSEPFRAGEAAGPSDLEELLARATTIDRWASLRTDMVWLEPGTEAQALVPAVFDLDTLVDTVLGQAAQQAAWRGCQVSSYRHPARLGAMQGHRDRLSSLLTHLVALAVDASTATGSPGRVQCKVLHEGVWLTLDVVDDSPGLPQERIDRWFAGWDTGRELPPPDGEGLTGWRLLMVRALAWQAGGTLRARGMPGHGNRWLVQVPLNDGNTWREGA